MTAPLPSHDLDTAAARDAERWHHVRAAVTLDALPGRDLDKRELLELASSIAADPELWREHVAYDDDNRHYVSLYRDAHVDVWVLCWTPRNDTGWHDHDVSSGAVAVAEGALVEHNLAVGVPSLATEVPGLPGLLLRPGPHPPAHRTRRGQRVDPHLLAAAVADGAVHGRAQRDPAAHRGLLRRRTASPGRHDLTHPTECAVHPADAWRHPGPPHRDSFRWPVSRCTPRPGPRSRTRPSTGRCARLSPGSAGCASRRRVWG